MRKVGSTPGMLGVLIRYHIIKAFVVMNGTVHSVSRMVSST